MKNLVTDTSTNVGPIVRRRKIKSDTVLLSFTWTKLYFLMIFLGGAKDQTQGLVHAGKALYYLATFPKQWQKTLTAIILCYLYPSSDLNF
jgi:hypothetical protein